MKQYWDLTQTQNKILAYYEDQIGLGNMPSLRDAARDNGVTHTAIAQSLRILDEKGYIKRLGKFSRSLHLLKKSDEGATVKRFYLTASKNAPVSAKASLRVFVALHPSSLRRTSVNIENR